MKRFIIIFIIASYTHIFADIIYVPQDFLTIQEAINYASAGDTIIVSAGTYSEYLIINKPLRILGSTEDSTIVESVYLGLQSKITNTSDVMIENLYFKIIWEGQLGAYGHALIIYASQNITFINTGFYGSKGIWGFPGEDGGDGVIITSCNNINFLNSSLIGGNGGAGLSSAGMGFDGGDGGNGLTIHSSQHVFIDSSIIILGIGGMAGHGSYGSGEWGNDGFSIYLTTFSDATVNNSIFIGDYFCDITSTLNLFNVVNVQDGVESEFLSFVLHQNYPNPFNPSTSIQYALNSRQFVSLKVYDVLGNEIATLVNEEKPAGEYNVEFSIDNLELSSGIFFYQLRAGDFIETRKMVLLK